VGTFFDWLDHRTGYRRLRDALLIEHIPGGARWRYVWGSTLAFVFAIQVITGILLMTAYVPGDEDAWGSVYFIQYEMDFGWLIRGLHHFGSQTMVVLMAVHLLQVVIAGAHLPPREINWWLGLALMGLILGLGLTGYLLPWDQKGYYATQVATNILGNTPLIGAFLQKALVGGSEYGHQTLTHFFALHVGILPPLVVILVILHLAAFRRHGVTAPVVIDEANPHAATAESVARAPVHDVLYLLLNLILAAGVGGAAWFLGVPTITVGLMAGLFVFFGVSRFFIKPTVTGHFWPDQAFRDLVVCLWIFAIMVTLVLFAGHGHKIDTPGVDPESQGLYEYWAKAGQHGYGANLDAPADPMTESYPARPEWYFLFLFQMLKYFKGDQEILGTMVIPGAVGFLLFILPLLGYGRMRRFGHVVGILVVTAILCGAAALTLLAFADDSPDFDAAGLIPRTDKQIQDAKKHQKRLKHAGEEARAAVHAAGDGIPAEGARFLIRGNPRIMGEKLFKQHCASCHAYEFNDEPEIAEAGQDGDKKKPAQPEPKASDLTGFAGEKWIRRMLENPGDPKYFGRTPRLTRMTEWRLDLNDLIDSAKDPVAAKKEVDFQLDEISWWLAEQAKSSDEVVLALKEPDYAKRFAQGKLFFFDDEKGQNCGSCHKVEKEGNKGPGPDLTGYGSAAWVHGMVLSPGHRSRYGGTTRIEVKGKGKVEVPRNTMPAFRPPPDTPGDKIAMAEFLESQPEFPKETILYLTNFERELIVRFLTGDHRVVFGGQPVSGPPKRTK